MESLKKYLQAGVICTVLAFAGCDKSPTVKQTNPEVYEAHACVIYGDNNSRLRTINESNEITGVGIFYAVDNWKQEGLPSKFSLVDTGNNRTLDYASYYGLDGMNVIVVGPNDKGFEKFKKAYDWVKNQNSLGNQTPSTLEKQFCGLVCEGLDKDIRFAPKNMPESEKQRLIEIQTQYSARYGQLEKRVN